MGPQACSASIFILRATSPTPSKRLTITRSTNRSAPPSLEAPQAPLLLLHSTLPMLKLKSPSCLWMHLSMSHWLALCASQPALCYVCCVLQKIKLSPKAAALCNRPNRNGLIKMLRIPSGCSGQQVMRPCHRQWAWGPERSQAQAGTATGPPAVAGTGQAERHLAALLH